MAYEFILRESMPSGFRENPGIPELPAAGQYLLGLTGRLFATQHDFISELAGFLDYLRAEKIPAGSDSEVRRGLFLFRNDTVGTYNDGISKRCEFGRLVEIVSQ